MFGGLYKNLLLLNIVILSGTIDEPFIMSNISACKADDYYSWDEFLCKSCPANQTTDPEVQHACICKPQYVESNIYTSPCYQCSEGFHPSPDKTVCVQCLAEEDKSCDTCPDNSIEIKNFINATTYTKKCVTCPSNMIYNKKEKKCSFCHIFIDQSANSSQCSCPKSTHFQYQDYCMAISELAFIPEWASSFKVRYGKGRSLTSKFFVENYRPAAYLCTVKNKVEACHLLANLCVLLQYSYENELGACGFYRAKYSGYLQSAKFYGPMIYYPENTANVFLSHDKINRFYSFNNGKGHHNIHFFVRTYLANGKFQSFEPLEHIFPCVELAFNLRDSFTFGVSFKLSCKLLPNDLLRSPMRFADLFLRYADKNGTKLYPIPILNLNYKHKNKLVNTLDKDAWQLVQRFYIFDNLSGIKSSMKNETVPLYIRVIDEFEIIVQLQKNSSGQLINPPLATIKYGEILKNDYNKLHSIHFKVSYKVNIEYTYFIVSLIVSLLCLLSSIFAIINFWAALKRKQSRYFALTDATHFVYILCGYISNGIFVSIASICVFWSILYKWQDVAWLFVPSESQEGLFRHYIIAAFVLKLVYVVFLLRSQTNANVFIIDWEQPKATDSVESYKKMNLNKKRKYNECTVSIWRTYFIANEFNELQTIRKLNCTFIIFTVVVVVEGLDLQLLSKSLVSLDENLNPDIVPYSFVCRLAMILSVYCFVAFCNFVYHVVFYERYVENKLQTFVDLCSMANISVFILTNNQYGYYIHGRSVYGYADTDMGMFYEQLQHEENDLCGKRGLEASCDCQTFEMVVTEKFLQKYNGLVRKFADGKTLKHVAGYEEMKAFLTNFLQHAEAGHDFIIKEKLFLENILDIEFQSDSEKNIFFKDSEYKFSRCLLFGIESTLLSFEMLVFIIVDIATMNFIIDGFITLVVHKLIIYARHRAGKKNTASKTLVDQRFLL